MRILSVVQRYGNDVGGGAERSCAELAERLMMRGHAVEVLTTDAVTYGDWQPGFSSGRSVENDVVVHRLPVTTRMNAATFEPLNQRVIGAAFQGRHVPMFVQREWLQALGPVMTGIGDWVDANVERFDVICVHTLGYWHATAAITAIGGRRPVVLHPLAHDEPNLALPIFDAALRGADGFAFLTPEEQTLIERRAGRARPAAVIGLGIEPPALLDDHARRSIRSRLGLGESEAFLLCAGRVDHDKGVHALAAMWVQAPRGERPVLVVAGEIVHSLAASDVVRVVGALTRDELAASMAEAVAVVHPSPFESFAIVLAEAWAQGTPTLVNASCDVLVGQCRRSGGGLAWHDLAELEEQTEALCASPQLRAVLGERGRQAVAERMRWVDTMDRYEALLERVVLGPDVDPEGVASVNRGVP